jgi:hypothetical protein
MCKRQVIDNGQPAQGFDIDVMRHGGHWIDEEKHGIKLPFTDHRTQLLIPSQRTAFQADHIQGGMGIPDPCPRGAGCKKDALASGQGHSPAPSQPSQPFWHHGRPGQDAVH